MSSEQIEPTGPDVTASGSFTEGSVLLHVFKLGGSLSLGYSCWVVASLLEAFYLGMLGTEQLAAVAFTMPVTMVVMSMTYGLGIGASSVIARSMGRGDRGAVLQLCTHSMLLGWAVISILGLVGFHSAHRIFELLGATPEILVFIDEYISIWFLGVPFFAPALLASSLLRATGSAVVPGLLMALGPFMQILLGPFLIFGWLGIPALGIKGAALAYILGRLIAMVFGLYVIIFRERLLTASLSGMLESWRAILHVGLPSMATSCVGPFASAIVTRLLAGYGPAVVAGFSVGMKADSFVMMILMATGSSVGPFIGMNWSAGQLDRVRLALRTVKRLCLGWGGFCCVLMFVFAGDIAMLINQDPVVVSTATLYLRIVPVSIAFMGLQNAASSTFNALGKPLPSMILSMAGIALIYLPLAMLGNWIWGYIGILFATTFTSIVVGGWAWVWMRRVIDRETGFLSSAPVDPGIELRISGGSG